MTNKPAPLQVSAVVQTLLPHDCGFAVMGDGRSVFMPKSVVRGSGAQVGDPVNLTVVDNYAERCTKETPYRAIFGVRAKAVAAAAALPKTGDAQSAIEELLQRRHIYATGDLDELVPGSTEDEVDNALVALKRASKAVEITVDRSDQNGEDIESYWAHPDYVYDLLQSLGPR